MSGPDSWRPTVRSATTNARRSRRRRVGRILGVGAVIAALVWGGYKLSVTRMPWASMPATDSCETVPATVAHVEDVIPDAEPVACERWDIGTGVAGFVWHAAQPRGAVLYQHGWGDYSQRNVQDSAALFTHLLAEGYSVYAIDMWGSGRSPGVRGLTDANDAIQDSVTARRNIAAGPDGTLPLFLMGHSLGGLVTISSALDDQADLAGVVLLAPGLKYEASGALLTFARVAGVFAPTVKLGAADPNAISEITRDSAAADKLRADPLIAIGAMNMLTAGTAGTRAQDNWSRYSELTVPLLVVHGDADVSTDPQGSVDMVESASSQDKQLLLIPGARHDLLNDLDAVQVRDDVLAWLAARTG